MAKIRKRKCPYCKKLETKKQSRKCAQLAKQKAEEWAR